MTQTLTKGSSWRTLRRKVLVTASSVALVAGMGVALAPAAQAARNGDLTITVNDQVAGPAAGEGAFPGVVANTGSDTVLGFVTVKNNTGAEINKQPVKVTGQPDNTYEVDITATGTGLGNIISGDKLTLTSGLLDGSPVDLLHSDSVDSRTLKKTVALPSTVSGDFDELAEIYEGAFNLAVKTDTAPTSWTGNITITISIVERNVDNDTVATLGTVRITTKVANPATPAFNTDSGSDDLSATFPLQTATEVEWVKSFGVPAVGVTSIAAGNGSTTISTVENVTTVKDKAGNVFSFDASTGVASAAATAVKGIPATPAELSVTLSGATPAATSVITFNVGFKDHAKIAETLQSNVYWAAGEGIVEGYEDGTFRPTAPVTRQAFAAFLYRAQNGANAKAPACSSFSPSGFSDVAVTDPFCAEIRWLASTGVTTGYTDGTFRASEPITRQAIAAMLYRVDQLAKGFNTGSPSWSASAPGSATFNDVAVTAPFAGEIQWAYSSGVANGYDDGGFHPAANSSRQATVSFLERMFS